MPGAPAHLACLGPPEPPEWLYPALSHLQSLARLSQDSLIPNSSPHPPEHCSTPKMAWSSNSVHALPSSLNDPGNPHSTLCCAKQASLGWGAGGFQMRKAGPKDHGAPSSSAP